jgi:hypothetical protein
MIASQCGWRESKNEPTSENRDAGCFGCGQDLALQTLLQSRPKGGGIRSRSGRQLKADEQSCRLSRIAQKRSRRTS